MASDPPTTPRLKTEPAHRDPFDAARINPAGCLAGAGVLLLILGGLLFVGAPTFAIPLIVVGVALGIWGLVGFLRGGGAAGPRPS